MRDQVWPLCRGIEALQPASCRGSPRRAAKRFGDVFGQRSADKELDLLPVRLWMRKTEMLKVLERAKITHHSKASETACRHT